MLLYCYEYDGKRYLVTKMYRLRLARISMWLNQDLGDRLTHKASVTTTADDTDFFSSPESEGLGELIGW